MAATRVRLILKNDTLLYVVRGHLLTKPRNITLLKTIIYNVMLELKELSVIVIHRGYHPIINDKWLFNTT